MKYKIFNISLVVIFQFLFITLSAQNYNKMFFVFLNTNPDRETLDADKAEKLQAAHLANIDSLYETGDLLAAGPFTDKGGFFILNAATDAQAKKIFNTDPAILANRFIIESFLFKIDAGGICKYKKPAEMKEYAFVRWYQKQNEEIDVVKYNKLLDKQADFFSEIHLRDSLHLAGNFSALHEGIMLFDLTSEEEIKLIVESSPMHNSGKFDYKLKRLWVAEGTFCRKD
ncbi:MAG: YciI family protein [Bacteroidota bacterium]|nr:YciI family protein [Bacteroidota bacterium]